jgi:hypothetical protein
LDKHPLDASWLHPGHRPRSVGHSKILKTVSHAQKWSITFSHRKPSPDSFAETGKGSRTMDVLRRTASKPGGCDAPEKEPDPSYRALSSTILISSSVSPYSS